jgi:MSHA biogenesis protein MshK
MVDRLNSRRLCAACALAAGLFAVGVQAQSLSDPTRPPNAAAPGSEEAPPGNQLQSVLLSGGRKLAVINGVTVPLGGRYGDARLVRITETEVALRTGNDIEVLKMYPGVDKTSVKRKQPRHGGTK